jgi:molybdopterin-containing oxidoreductase family iron-sulfur binding subunit
MLNPNVVAREMGIMEKCTFCIQRIRDFKDTWRDENGFASQGSCSTNDADYARITACAAACPSDAITFGNLNVADSAVAKKFEDRRAYRMLDELNTKPGVAYLTRIVHTESELHHGGHGGGHGGDHGDSGHGHEHGKDADHGHGATPGHGSDAKAHEGADQHPENKKTETPHNEAH